MVAKSRDKGYTVIQSYMRVVLSFTIITGSLISDKAVDELL